MSISLALPTYIFLCSITWENLTLNRIALCMNPIESIIIHIIERKVGENGAFPPTRDGCIHSLSMRERG